MNWFQKQNTPPKGSAPDPRALKGDGDALAAAVAQFLTKTGLFDRDAYIANNPEVTKSGLDPIHHFMRVGIHTAAKFTSVAVIAKLWREVLREPPSLEIPKVPHDLTRYRPAIYVSGRGNFFMREIAEVLQAGFADAGVSAALHSEDDGPAQNATHHIVIAPHEFFVLGNGRQFATDEFVSKAILFSTEQVQTPWFARSLPFLLRARAVADMNAQTSAILQRGGVRAITVQPGFSAAYTAFDLQSTLPNTPAFAGLTTEARQFDVNNPDFAARPLDVLFLGSVSKKREEILASMAPKLASLNTYMYATRMTRPLDAKVNPTASPQVSAALLQRSKVMLNIHRDDYTYFEWWRLMQAFWQRTLVVSEPCFPHPIFSPGVHYLEEAPRHIPHLLEWLVRSRDGQKKADEIRNQAHVALVNKATAKNAALLLLTASDVA